MFFNQIRFDSFKYAYESVTKTSELLWVPVNTEFRQTYPFEVQTKAVFLQDYAVDLDDFTELEFDHLFSLK